MAHNARRSVVLRVSPNTGSALRGRRITLASIRDGPVAKLHTPRFNPTTWFAIASIPMIVGAAFFTIAASEVQIEKSHPVLIDNVWCRLGILLLALGGVAAVFGVIGGLARWRDESITPFKLSLDGAECVQFRPNFNDHQVRVNLTNKSPLGVVDVRLKIRDRDPGGYSHYLAQMHDANGVLSLGGDDLAPGDSLFVDVASTRAGASDFAFSFAAPHLWGQEVNSVPLHTFTLVVRGRFEETRRSVKAGRGRFQLTFTPEAGSPLVLSQID